MRLFGHMTAQVGLVLAIALAGEAAESSPGQTAETPSILDILKKSTRVLWLGAHPDDETSAGALLARAKDLSGTLFLASMTKGENHDKLWGGLRRGSAIGEARATLFGQAAELLKADGLEFGPFVNGPHSLADLEALPPNASHQDWSPTARSDDVIAKWSTEEDPLGYLVKLLRQRQPDAVVSMDDHCGVTGHDEHIAVARLLLQAIPLAADPAAYPEAGQPWHVGHVIFSAHVTPQLIACRYCKCEGAPPAAPKEEVFSLDTSQTHGMTYLEAQCRVAKLYQNAVEQKRWTERQMRAACEKASAAAKRAYRPGQKGQPFFESYRVRVLE